ncbi:hypothetical protein ACN4EG_08255 [Alkalinema pantanalense CENA528]
MPDFAFSVGSAFPPFLFGCLLDLGLSFGEEPRVLNLGAVTQGNGSQGTKINLPASGFCDQISAQNHHLGNDTNHG